MADTGKQVVARHWIRRNGQRLAPGKPVSELEGVTRAEVEGWLRDGTAVIADKAEAKVFEKPDLAANYAYMGSPLQQQIEGREVEKDAERTQAVKDQTEQEREDAAKRSRAGEDKADFTGVTSTEKVAAKTEDKPAPAPTGEK